MLFLNESSCCRRLCLSEDLDNSNMLNYSSQTCAAVEVFKESLFSNAFNWIICHLKPKKHEILDRTASFSFSIALWSSSRRTSSSFDIPFRKYAWGEQVGFNYFNLMERDFCIVRIVENSRWCILFRWIQWLQYFPRPHHLGRTVRSRFSGASICLPQQWTYPMPQRGKQVAF